MAFALAPDATRAGYRLVAHDVIDSTSAEALRLAQAGEVGPLWIVARRQSAGVGRRGATWHSPPGNHFASLLLTTDLSPARLATLGFVAGIALDEALARCCAGLGARVALDGARAGRDRFTLKWPNDVLADGAKLAGIALATEEIAPGRRAVVIGIGVNVAHAPEGLPYPAASLHGLGFAADAETLFHALSATWIEAHADWAGRNGFVAIRERWLERAAGVGGPVAVRSGEHVLRGVFETIDEHGQLVVRTTDGGVRTVSAGDVHFGIAASAAA